MRSPEPMPLSFGRVLGGQIRAVGFALTREAMLAGAALALVCILSISMAWREDDKLHFTPELLTPALFFAAYLPFSVWKGDPPFGHAFLWTMPVRRQQSAIAKVLAGAFWMMVAMLVTFAALSMVAWLSGGGLGIQRTRLLDNGTPIIEAAVKIVWTMPAWMWLTPFVGVLTVYLASSAAILGLRHPIRVLVGIAFAMMLIGTVILNFAERSDWVREGFEQVTGAIWEGELGFGTAISGGEETLAYSIRDASGKWHRLWRAMPEFGSWAMAAGLWLMLALGALGLAIRRHWER